MRRGTCVFFTPLRGDNSKCRQGINYVDAFKKPGRSVMTTMPCVTMTERCAWTGQGEARKLVTVLYPVDRKGEAEVPCAKREMPTEADLARHGPGSHIARKPNDRRTVEGRRWWEDHDK